MYLFDTSTVSDIVNKKSARHLAVHQFVEENRRFEKQIFLSDITLGELRFGREIFSLRIPTPSIDKLQEIDDRVKEAESFCGALQINRHVAINYATLRAAYAKGVAPNMLANGKLKGIPPELWQTHFHASQLQITENDFWIAAIAVTYEMILVTGDKDYSKIATHYPSLQFIRI